MGGKLEYISRTAFELQRFPAEVINATIDQELLPQLAHLVEEWVFILGRDMYNLPVRNRSNK